MSAFQLSKESLSQLAGVNARLVAVVQMAIEVTTQDFCVYDGTRTAEEQNALYQKGRTRPGPKVTDKDGYKNKSNHQITADGTGHSVDLVPVVGGKPTWDDSWSLHWPVALAMAEAGRRLGVPLRWGGNWYERLTDYGDSINGLRAAVDRYKVQHPGSDFLDAPHFELAT